MTININFRSFWAGLILGVSASGIIYITLLNVPRHGISNISLLNIVTGGASIILAIVAIGISLYHYDRAKRTEQDAATALEGIRSQTTTLQEITSEHMGKLIDAGTRRSAFEEAFSQQWTQKTAPPQGEPIEPQKQWDDLDIINAALVSYYYAALANVSLQFVIATLPLNLLSQIVWLKTAIDGSNQSIFAVNTWMDSLSADRKTEVAQLSNFNFYEFTKIQFVDTSMIKTMDQAISQKDNSNNQNVNS